MAHVRKQIRDAATTAVTGLTTTGSNVFAGRGLPLNDAELPALCVYTRTDSPDYENGAMGSRPVRALELVIEGYTKAADDDDLDQLAAEVETAIYVDETFGGLAQGMELGDQELTAQDEAEQTTGLIRMVFIVFYRTAEGAPETAV